MSSGRITLRIRRLRARRDRHRLPRPGPAPAMKPGTAFARAVTGVLWHWVGWKTRTRGDDRRIALRASCSRTAQRRRSTRTDVLLRPGLAQRSWRFVPEPIRPQGDEVHSDVETRMGGPVLAEANGSKAKAPPRL